MHTHDVDIDFDEENSEKERVLQKWYREASELLLRSNNVFDEYEFWNYTLLQTRYTYI